MAMSLGKAEINVTPMIDVLLVLIIIFMVVIPQNSVGLPSVIPQPAADNQPLNEADIVVTINQDRSLSVNQEPITFDKLADRLGAIFAARANKVIFVKGHEDLDFREVAKVIDLARGVGILQVGLMTQ